MDLASLYAILKRISLPELWKLRAVEKGDGFLIQIVFVAQDSNDPSIKTEQFCRKWYVSSHATLTEVVRTVHQAGIMAITHEFNEQFKFDGVAIANSHISCEEMAKLNLKTEVRA